MAKQKKGVKLSKNEEKAKKAGVSVKEYNKSKKGKSSNKKSSKDSGDFIDALKKKGAYDAYQRMSPDQQSFLRFNFETATSDNKDKVKKLEKALVDATAQADPYWKSFLTVVKDEVARAFDDVKNTSEYQKTELETKIKNIADDLARNKDFYTLEQQSDLAKLKMSYEQQRTGVIEDAAAKGLTFSTQREVPLKQLEDYNANVVESTNRQYENKLTGITTAAQQSTDEALRAKEKLAADTAAKLTDIGRETEKQLGTENLPTLEGYTPLGNISGDLYENKVKDIEARKQALYDQANQTSLQF